ncbi:MAG TPA: glycine--tRNA ligase [Lacunisphaera sp.]|nr:glycine--tRNA ligase [Lacunisphaera sp.]
MPDSAENPNLMEALVSLAKRRGFIYASSEIYGGLNGFFDYGPLGAELKRNIRECWWRDMVHRREDVVGIETSIIMHPKVWEASGHVAGFTDPLVDCKETKQRYRADQLYFAKVVATYISPEGQTTKETLGYVAVVEDSHEVMRDEAHKRAKVLRDIRKGPKPFGVMLEAVPNTAVFLRPYEEASSEERSQTLAPAAKESIGTLTEPRAFNMMFETNVGALKDASSVAYLRPETAQGMFVDFKNVVDTTRVKLPFGIAQIGKSFRNEITPRNFIFRSREFEQMEMEYFIHEDADWAKAHEEWIVWCENWLKSIGLPASHLSRYTHPKEKLAFYSRGTVDIMFKYPFGVQELWGIAARGSYDLTQHANASGKPQELFDEATKKKFVPHVIEPAVGVDRIFLAVLAAGYAEEDVKDEKGNVEKRTVLRLSPRIAPVKVAVLPLLKNKEVLTNRARALYTKLQKRYAVQYDDGGAIGKRYRRQDEAGTPWCVTIDFDTIEKPGDTFTLRERDSMAQKRITESELFALLEEQVY